MKQDKLTTKLKELDAQAHANLCKSNELAERCGQIPQEISALEKEILHVESEQEIEAKFKQIEGLRLEQRQKNLLARRAEIKRLEVVSAKHRLAFTDAAERHGEALGALPTLIESLETAQSAVAQQEALIQQLASKAENEERAVQAAENERSQLEQISFSEVGKNV